MTAANRTPGRDAAGVHALPRPLAGHPYLPPGLVPICLGWLEFIEWGHRRGVEQFGSSLGS
jgi:hypothetical protein